MTIHWNKIRSFNGSQNNAFEELVCQLANAEPVNKKINFIRVAAPDGGIESFVELENGKYYGWQAKFFINSFNASQWQQIEESFKEALKNYPTLCKYYICCPVDRNNAGVEGRNSFLKKWESYTKKWSHQASLIGRNITFEYWGSYELIDRLSQEKNIGKLKFWFSDHEFSMEWFKTHNQTAVANLGHRYTPEINVDLPIALNLEAVTRTKAFKERFTKISHTLLAELDETSFRIKDEISIYKNLNSLIPELRKELDLNQYDLLRQIPSNYLKEIIEDTLKIIEEKRQPLWNKKEREDSDTYLLNNLNKAFELLQNLKTEICSSAIELFNGKTLLLSGQAGQGKSHLLGDFIENKEKQNGHLFFLGQEFTEKSNIWYQILIKNLRINVLEKDFLLTLETIAELNNERFVLVIDALNEGEGRKLWPDYLNGFLKLIAEYPRISLIMTIRDSYKKQICSKLTQDSNKLICEIYHQGFNELEFDACKIFFDYYKIETPRIPLLNPEFSNPLYLKLFCESLKVQNLNTIPKGFNGIFNIINCYISGINQAISEKLDIDASLMLVNIALNVIVESQLDQQSNSLLFIEIRRKIAKVLIEDISDFQAKQFLDLMVVEGILAKNINYGCRDEIVYFTYERMGDYISVEYLLNKFSSFTELLDWIQSSNNDLFDLDNFHYNNGLWQALSVLAPVKYNVELFDYIKVVGYRLHDFKNLIIESLVWRDPNKIHKESVIIFLNEGSLSKSNWRTFFDTLYQIIAEENHPFNGVYLHEYLKRYSLADRDAFWTIFISNELSFCPAITRLIKWCLNNHNNNLISQSSMLNIAIGISWLCATTNTQTRNEATNALSSILINRIDVSIKLINLFYDTNDPYVLERVLLAIYSSILSSTQLEKLPEIASQIDELIFKTKEGQEVYPNVLIRDYAKNIIQYNLYKNNDKFNQAEIESINNRITAPYNSKLPKTFPTISEIDKIYKYNKEDPDFKDYYYSANRILWSMTTEYGRGIGGYGDFGRYTFESKFYGWNKIINIDLLSNYACKLIFDKFGYDVEKHGQFDRDIRYTSRYENGIERIGKKYQWLALYEILAQVIDCHQCSRNYWNDNNDKIWLKNINNLNIRETDPMFFINKKNNNYTEYTNSIPEIKFQNWNGDLSSWIINEDIPTINPMIEFELKGEKWLVLERNLDFSEPDEFGVYNNKNKKNLWIQIKSYFIPKINYPVAIDWLQKQHFMGQWMPEANTFNDLFCKEYYWSQAYLEQLSGNEWKNLERWGDTDLSYNVKVMSTVERHSWESRRDENNYSFLAPCNLLIEKLLINYSNTLGYWQDNEGRVIAFDPSVAISSYSKNILAIKKADLEKFLKENGLKIFWTALGSKWYTGSLYENSDAPSQRIEFSGVFELYRGKLKGEPRIIIQDFKREADSRYNNLHDESDFLESLFYPEE